MLMKGKDGGDKAKARNSIRQPLIGEDVPMLWRIAISARLCMDLWLTPGIYKACPHEFESGTGCKTNSGNAY